MSAGLIARLIEAGTPAALVAEVAMALGKADADREAIEARRASDRERKAKSRPVKSRDGTGLTGQDVTPSPKEKSPTPPKEITPTQTTSPLRSDVPPPAAVDQDADLFRRGREVIGRNAGSQVSKLKDACEGSIAKARSIIEVASTKDQPADYVAGAIVKLNGRSSTGPPRGGPDEIQDNTTRALLKLAAEYSH